ncbi:hypothetical protein LJC10_00955 [Selenomonadales bacterium OttesenSCG-928-I06]|nr:hypothetical protein [Selenomonadales bacterium OttesenSCG-928-I06]
MIIDFDEQKFREEVKKIVRPYGITQRQFDKIMKLSLNAIRKASQPVNR